MSFKTKDFKITFLGVTPVLKDETGYLKPQDIVALSALMTFKGKSVKDLYQDAIDKGQAIDDKVKKIIRKSSLRGHASIATTPAICFTYEASKFIDSLMTGMVFSSSLMASGRRTDTTVDDIVYPTSIDANKDAKALYKKTSEENINFFNFLLQSGVEKDDASKALQYGIYGTGIIAYPIESLIAFKKELEAEGEWVPEEAKMFLLEIEKYLKKMGVDLIYASRDLAARNTLPFPNIFRDPAKTNITRELIKKKDLGNDLSDIIDFNATITPGLEKRAKEIYLADQELAKNPKNIKKQWREGLKLRHEFLRDYNTVLNLKTLSSVSWRVWGDRKRHRTVPQTPDSIYYAINRAQKVFEIMAKKIDSRKLTDKDLRTINRAYTILPSLKLNQDLLYGYLIRAKESFEAYNQLVNKYKVKPSDAVFVILRGIRIDMVSNFDLFNLISGYYPIRTCSTADVQLRNMTRQEMIKIKQFLEKKGLKYLAKLMVTKCWIAHFCLEEKHCPVVNGLLKDYNEKFHEEMKAQLDEEFEEGLKNLGK